MLKAFCDACGNPYNRSVPNRRYENLLMRPSGKVGLEIIPLRDGNPSQDHHICDDCLSEFLWNIFRSEKNSGAARKVELIEAKEKKIRELEPYLKQREIELNKKDAKLTEREKKIEETEKEFAAKAEELNKEREAEEVEEVKKQVVSAKTARENRILEAQRRQLEEDKKNYPEYVANVESREERRKRG